MSYCYYVLCFELYAMLIFWIKLLLCRYVVLVLLFWFGLRGDQTDISTLRDLFNIKWQKLGIELVVLCFVRGKEVWDERGSVIPNTLRQKTTLRGPTLVNPVIVSNPIPPFIVLSSIDYRWCNSFQHHDLSICIHGNLDSVESWYNFAMVFLMM